MQILIVGAGAAGLHAAFTCRECWPKKSVTLIDAEREIGYYRTLLPKFMVADLEEENLFFWRPRENHFLTVLRGIRAEFVDRANRILQLENKEKLHFERLILAHGTQPYVPSIFDEFSCHGVFPIRDLNTARDIREWIFGHQEIIILGGSLVAVKTAVHLRLAGLNVSLVVRRDNLLLRLLTPRAARLVEDYLRAMGIHLFLGSSLSDFHVKRGSLKAINVESQWLPCQTLLLATGSTPKVEFLENSGLLENGKLFVSPALQTLDEKIYAAGDGATITISKNVKLAPRTWPQAISQGKLAAANLYESAPTPLSDLTYSNALNLQDLPLVILGVPVPECEVVSYAKPAEGILRELFIVDGRIVGGALVGDISGAGPLHAMIKIGEAADKADYDMVQPHRRMLSRASWNYFTQKRGFLSSHPRR